MDESQSTPLTSRAGLPSGMDALSLGKAFFGAAELPAVPQVEGFSQITWLASGGFGTVWRARRDTDGLEVALKIPHRIDPETAERLEQEAGALLSLEHPNIVRLHGVTVTADAAPVLVMELVNGFPLTRRLPDRGFEFEQVLQLFLPVLDAVAHAHRRGIVHRDLKPGNILLDADGRPRITDFGLASPLHGQQVAFALTQSGIVAGTVEYIAPECYEHGSESGDAVDIYALGIILYELLTGRPPRGAWQPPSQLRQVDIRLDDLILEAIHPEPGRRLASAAVFKSRLEEIRDTRPRYRGAPLVTRRVRMADALWTLAGLYCLAAAFCALQRVNNTEVPAFFDLSFGHTYMLGGFWALWVLTAAAGLLWLWQLVRLWKFRCIPLREALPSPLGLRLGHSRGAAVGVAAAQLLCLWAPLLYMGWLYAQIWHWADASTPPWHRVLAITRWGSTEPVSMWTWDPAGMTSGDEFWVREMQPGYPEKTWMLHDRQSFLVVTQPLIMTLGVAAIGAGLAATAWAALREWRTRRPAVLLLAGLAVAAAGFYQQQVRGEIHAWRQERLANADSEESVAREACQRHAFPRAQQLFLWLHSNAPGPLPLSLQDIAPVVTLAGGRQITAPEFLATLQQRRSTDSGRHQVMEDFRHRELSVMHGESGASFVCTVYREDAQGASCSVLTTTFRSRAPGDGWLTAWEESEQLIYDKAESRNMGITEAAEWLTGFHASLTSPERHSFAESFLPLVLIPDPDTPAFDLAVPATEIADWLRGSFSGIPVSDPEVSLLCGKRTLLRIQCMSPAERPSCWALELVSQSGQWRIIRFRTGGRPVLTRLQSEDIPGIRAVP